MTPPAGDATFHWLLHQVPSLTWLKADVAARRPDLRFAFSRPGLSTFKGPADAPSLTSPYARASGRSLGRATSVEEVLTLAAASDATCLHVFERDPDRPADERDPQVAGTRARAVDAAVRAAAPSRFAERTRAEPGELVLDVITAAAEHADDGWLVGWHVHGPDHGPFPGGVAHATIPASAPSRAWAKLEEAIAWSGLEPRAGDTAVELGASPGGACWALLERGLDVWGVDPGAMAPEVLGYVGARGNRFVHLHQPAAEVDRRALPPRIDWLASDVNLAPMVALRYVERFVALARGQLRGAFLTLKLNDDGIAAALPRLLERIGKLGARSVRTVQLPSHRSEVVAILAW